MEVRRTVAWSRLLVPQVLTRRFRLPTEENGPEL